MPPGRPALLLTDTLTLLFANGLALRYLAAGEMTPFELVVLVALEALLLSAVARGHRLLVPRAARIPPQASGRHPLVTLVFGLAWLAIVYWLVFWIYFDVGPEIALVLADPLAFLAQPQIRWPLLITAVGAAADAIGDHLHYLRHRGFFVSSPELNGLARWMTLFLGAIPFLIPLLVLGIGLATVVKRFEQRQRASSALPALWLIVVLMASLSAILAVTVFGLYRLGLVGWAIGFVSAKLASEALAVSIPTVVARIGQEDREGGEASAGRPRGRA
jgi:hypothetical protein